MYLPSVGKLLVNNNEQTEQLQQTGVYKLACQDCETMYIGHTGRSIKKRITEQTINNSKNSTGIATHDIHNNNFLTFQNVKLLHIACKGKRLDLYWNN